MPDCTSLTNRAVRPVPLVRNDLVGGDLRWRMAMMLTYERYDFS